MACSAAWPLALQLSVQGGRRHWNPTELTIKPQFKNENVVVRLLNPRACRAGGLRNECPDAIPVPSTPSQPLHHPRSPRRRAIPCLHTPSLVSTRHPSPRCHPCPHNLSLSPQPLPGHPRPRSPTHPSPSPISPAFHQPPPDPLHRFGAGPGGGQLLPPSSGAGPGASRAGLRLIAGGGSAGAAAAGPAAAEPEPKEPKKPKPEAKKPKPAGWPLR